MIGPEIKAETKATPVIKTPNSTTGTKEDNTKHQKLLNSCGHGNSYSHRTGQRRKWFRVDTFTIGRYILIV